MCGTQGTVCSHYPMYSRAKFPQTAKRSSCTSQCSPWSLFFLKIQGSLDWQNIVLLVLLSLGPKLVGLCNSVLLCGLISSPTGFSPESSIAGCECNFKHLITLEQLTHLEWYFEKMAKIPNQTKKASFNESSGSLRFCFES